MGVSDLERVNVRVCVLASVCKWQRLGVRVLTCACECECAGTRVLCIWAGVLCVKGQ